MCKEMFIYQIYILLGIILTLVLHPFVLKILIKLKARQTLRKEGPAEHKFKEGTPTMGGLSILIPIIILTLAFSKFSIESIAIILTVIGFMMIGFIDDLLIVIKGKNDGIRPKVKLALQILVSILFAVYLIYSGHETVTNIPFTNMSVNLGLFYIPFIVFVMVAETNAVNLTDGLDGLASGTMAIAIIPFIIMLYFLNSGDGFTDASIIMGSVCIGSCLGFLWFNSHPASVFMGDTGSLPLGGIISILAIVSNNELWLIFAGFVFLIEALSVTIQVLYYKKTKKRIFLMSPLHHHFEKLGWKETKVTARFYLIGIIASLITVIGSILI